MASRKPMEIKSEVRKLRDSGAGIKTIARSLKISRNTVKAILKEPLGCAGPAKPVGPVSCWSQSVDWSSVEKEARSGAPIKTLHEELGLPGVSYDAFRLALKRRTGNLIDESKLSRRLQHKPGEMAQVDYADGIAVKCPESGKLRKTQLFCGVLPFSSYTFGEFTWDQKLPTFLRSHENMWQFFGGVSQYGVVDNLKAAVTKAHRYDPVENRTFCEFAEHWNFIVLPARPRTPRDKAAVESAIGAIQRSLFPQVRHRTFGSLHELNSAFREFLKEFNLRVMKDHGVSRARRFETERGHLGPLASEFFVMTEYKTAKVHPDCEIQFQKNFYSVPYVAVGREVRVKLTSRLLEVYEPESLTRLATHTRLTGVGKHSIHPWHYPSRSDQLKAFDMQAVRKRAREIGPMTEKALGDLIATDRPLRMLRRAQGILRLARKYPAEAIEYGSEMGLKFDKLNVRYIEQCASHFQLNGRRGPGASAPKRERSHTYLHSNQ